MQLTFHRLPIWILLTCLVALSAATSRAQARDANASGWLGVMVGGSRDSGEEAPEGVHLTRIIADGPAARAKLRARDRILAVDGEPVSSSGELIRRIKDLHPGAWVRLTVRRGHGDDDDEREVNLRLGERPARRKGFKVRHGWVGLQAIDLPPALREHFGATAEAGAMISFVETGSPAEAAGFALGDVVYEVDGRPVKSAAALAEFVEGGGVGNSAEFVIARYGASMELEALIEELPQAEPR